mmetsp:Transcript_4019/g.6367  ORF Transcript_4019/g.6367 Transcript_4019/m.6367 type:complete len:205 (-) Transcript_4019:3240-3854(-)
MHNSFTQGLGGREGTVRGGRTIIIIIIITINFLVRVINSRIASTRGFLRSARSRVRGLLLSEHFRRGGSGLPPPRDQIRVHRAHRLHVHPFHQTAGVVVGQHAAAVGRLHARRTQNRQHRRALRQQRVLVVLPVHHVSNARRFWSHRIVYHRSEALSISLTSTRQRSHETVHVPDKNSWNIVDSSIDIIQTSAFNVDVFVHVVR